MTAGDPTESAGSAKHRFLADVAALTIAGYLVQPILFASNLLTRRWLGPLLIGTFATLALIQQYAALSHLGVLQAAERELPFFRGAGDAERCDHIRTASWTTALTAGAVTALALTAVAFIAMPSLSPAMFHGLLAYAVVLLAVQCSSTGLTFLRAELRFQYIARINIFLVLCTASANVVGSYVFGFDGLLVATVVVTLVGCAIYARTAGLAKPRFSRSVARQARALIGIGIPLSILSFAAMGVHTMGSIAVLRLLGTEALGMYTLAISGANIIHGFSNSLAVALYPRMRSEHGRTGSSEAVLRFAGQPTLVLASVLPLLIAPLFFLIPVVVAAVVPKFIPGIPAFRITVVGIAFYALAQIPGLCLISLGKNIHLLGWYVLTLMACAISAFSLVPLGLEGIAIGAVVGHVVGFACANAHVLSLRENVRTVASWLARIVAPVLYGAVLLGVIEYFWRQGFGSFAREAIAACAKTTLFLAVYVPVLFLLEPHSRLMRTYMLPAWRRFQPTGRL
jgi:O-antigen/teichoic acid export membrane protein